MAKKKLNGDDITYENQGGVLVIDIKDGDRTLRFIFEDSFTYMVALLNKGEVVKTGVVDAQNVMDSMEPEQDDQDS